jgi:hypothetical protein
VIERTRNLTNYDRNSLGIRINPDSAIEELNNRFREHGIGYQFVNSRIFRIDSQFVHNEIIKTALTLIHQNDFEGAEDEFMKAHEHYRN